MKKKNKVHIKKKFPRYPKNINKIYFKKGRKIASINLKIFCKKNNVHDIIGMNRSDFRLIHKGNLTHFNIHSTNHKSGKKYLIIKIEKQGYFDKKKYVPRILSNKQFFFSKCVFTENYISYNKLNKNIFKNSINNIKNINSLKKAIKRRYKKSLAYLKNSEKMSLGIAITKLKIIEKKKNILV